MPHARSIFARSIAVSVLLLAAFTTFGFGAPLMIDTFGVPQGKTASMYGYQGSGAVFTGDTQADAIGGYRDVFVQISNPSSGPFEYVKQEITSGVLQYSSSTKAYGSVGIIYGSSQSLNLDLTDSFVKNDSFLFDFADPLSASISMILQLGSTNSSKVTANVTIPVGTKNYLVPFSLFSGPGGDPVQLIRLISPRFIRAFR